MWWPFTVLGGVAGMVLASIPGALLGGVLGQVLDRRLGLESWAELRALFGGAAVADEELLFQLLGRLAKSQGPVQEAHIQRARDEMRRLGLDEAGRRRAIEAFSRGKVGTASLRRPLRRLRSQRSAGEKLLRACWRMAWADGSVGSREHELILLWGQWLAWRAAEVEQLGKGYAPSASVSPPRHEGGAYQAALRVLGVTLDTDEASIKRAYRRLLSQHHPDKLAGAGASPARIRQATEKTGELHQAYRLVRERHGF